MKQIYILQNTDYYNCVFNAILKARQSIYISIFSFNIAENLDTKLLVRTIAKLLAKKHNEGIDVKVLFGNSYKLDSSKPFQKLDMSNELTFTVLKSYGVNVAFFNHYKQASSHSKYVVIDEESVFLGSHNFSPRAFGVGTDDSICVIDQNVAFQLAKIFRTDWKYSYTPLSSELVEFDNSFMIFPQFRKRTVNAPEISANFLSNLLLNEEYFECVLDLINEAKSSIDIIMFHFSFSKSKAHITTKLFNALLKAHKKGIGIRIILDRDNPKDIYASNRINKVRYDGLKSSGIDVRFDSDLSTTHSKLLIIDRSKVIIGSHNWTYGSFNDYQDVSIMISSKIFATTYKKIFDKRFSVLT